MPSRLMQYLNRSLRIMYMLVLMHALSANAQVAFNWAQNLYPTPIYSYTGKSLITDDDGSIYSCGAFAGTADMDPGPGVYSLTSVGYSDIFIRKQNSSGQLVWALRIGGSQNDLPSAICLDEHHRLYITGSFTNNVDFDPGPSSALLSTGSVANPDLFLLKLDTAGNYKWAYGMGSVTFQDHGTCIASDLHGHIIATGFFRQSVDFDPGPGVFTLTSSGLPNPYVLSLDTAGTFQWAFANLVTANAMSPVLAISKQQEIYVAGSFTGTYDFDPGIGVVNLTANGGDDIVVQKLNTGGQLLWAKSIGSTGNDKAGDIRVDTMGNLYLSGSFKSSMDADPGAGSMVLNSHGSDDIFLVKWNANASLQYATSFGGSSEDRSNGIWMDSLHAVYLTGYFVGTMDMDPGLPVVTTTSNGLTDAFVSKFNSNGQFVWGRSMGAYDFDYGYAITGDDLGHLYGLGAYRGLTDFDPGPGAYCPDTTLSTYLFKWDLCDIDTTVTLTANTLTAVMSGIKTE